jgi:hypothetical protein
MSLFSGILKVIKKPVAFVAKAAGTLVGLPALGAAASNLINSIGGAPKVTAMAKAAVAAGAVDTLKVAENLVKNGVPDTPANVSLLTDTIKKVAVADTEIPSVNKTSDLKTDDTAKKIPATHKFMDYIKDYWFIALPSGLAVIYLIYKAIKK